MAEEQSAGRVGEPGEYRFASSADVVRPARMVYIDFVQADPRAPGDASRISSVARVVVHPDALPNLIQQLSAVRDAAAE
jgi:hypothetical protein